MKVKSSNTTRKNLIRNAYSIADIALVEASKTDSPDSFPTDTIEALFQNGFLTMCAPLQYGGADVGIIPGTQTLLLELLKIIGSGNLVAGRVLEGHINAQILIHLYGTENQVKTYLEEAQNKKLFGVWNTQAADGTTLNLKKEGYCQLSGSKTFATGSGFVSRPLVTAKIPNGEIQMCLPNLDKKKGKYDASWWNPMGMRATRSYKINFGRTKIPLEDLLGKPGEYYAQPIFGAGSIRFSAVQLGGAERLVTLTRAYLQDLGRTQDPFQQMRVGKMCIAVASGNQWLHTAAEYWDQYLLTKSEKDSERLLYNANMARLAIRNICNEIILLTQECVGARGLNAPHHFERIIRDLMIYLQQPAPDAALGHVGVNFLQTEEDNSYFWNPRPLSEN